MFRRNKRLTTSDTPKLRTRAKRLSPDELRSAVDTSISNLGKYWPEWERTKDAAFLKEAMYTAEAIYIMVEVLVEEEEGSSVQSLHKPARQVKSLPKGRY